MALPVSSHHLWADSVWADSAWADSGTKAAQPTLRYAVDANAYPFTFARDGEYQGITVDILRALADHLDRRLELVPLPPKRGLQQFIEGGADAMSMPMITRGNMPGVIHADEPYFNSYFSAFALKNKQLAPTDFDQLRDYRVGMILGFTPIEEQLDLRSLQPQGYPNHRAMLRALLLERIDVAVIDDGVAMSLARELNAGQRIEPVYRFTEWPIGVGVSELALGRERAEALARELSRAIRALKRRGVIGQALKRYQMDAYFTGY